jgi:hypothetical protein
MASNENRYAPVIRGLRRRMTGGQLLARKGARAVMAAFLALSFTIGVPVQPSFALGGAHYVSPSGTATWAASTSISTPASLATALANYAGGDTVYLRGGTYASSAAFSRSGASGSRVAFAAYTGEVPVLSQGLTVSGSYLDISGVEVTPGRTGIGYGQGQVSVSGTYDNLTGFNIHDLADGTGLAFTTGAAHDTFSNFHIVKPYYGGIMFQGGTAQDTATSYNTILNGEVSGACGHEDSGGYGSQASIDVHGTGNVIDGVAVHDSIAPSPLDGDGIRPHGVDLVIRNCAIYDIWHGSIPAHTDAIQFWDHDTNLLIENNVIGSWAIGGIPDSVFPNDGGSQDAGTNIMMEAQHHVDVTIRNNVFLGSSYFAPINLNSGKPNADSSLSVKLYNNTFFNRGPVTLNTAAGALPVTLTARNNVFAGGTTYGTTTYHPGLSANNVTLDSDYNLYVSGAWRPTAEGPHSKTGSPLFVNPTVTSATSYGRTADFSLSAGSPAIGSGVVDANTPTTDKNGATRTGAMDMGAYAYGGSTVAPPADTTAPTVALTAPTTGSAVSGTVALAATASDSGAGIARVEFRVDNVLVGTSTTAPYTANWDASTATAGSHTVQARAIDAAGNVADSTAASVTVNVAAPADTTPPAVTLTAPTNGSTVSGLVPLAATASDSGSGIARVEFRVDNVLVGTSSTAPYTATWDASSATVGSHVVDVRAYDGAGNANSFNSTVNVAAPAVLAPPVLAAFPNAGAISLAWTPAAGSVGTRLLRSVVGYATSPTDPSATVLYDGAATLYSDSSVATGTTYYYAAFSRDAAGNWSTAGDASATLGVQPVIALAASSTTVKTNTSVTLRSQYLVSSVPTTSSAPVTVWSNASGAWQKIGVATYAKATKTYGYSVRVTKGAAFEMRSDATAIRAAAKSNDVLVQIKGYVSVATVSALSYGTKAPATATVSGSNPRLIKLATAWYSRTARRWIAQRSVTVRAKSFSAAFARFSTSLPLPKRGKWRLIGTHTANGVTTKSKAVYVTVR